MHCELMLTRSKIQCGEGELEEFNPEIGSRKGKMSSWKGEETTSPIPSEGEFLKSFMRMQAMVEELYQDRKKGEQGGQSHAECKMEVGGKEPPKSTQYSLTYVDGSSLYILCLKRKKGKFDLNVPQLKLDIKFELPIYNGELNVEQLDNSDLSNWSLL